MAAILQQLRGAYLRGLCRDLMSHRSSTKPPVLNFADKSSKASVELAWRLVDKIGAKVGNSHLSSQSLGERFPKHTLQFLKKAYKHLAHIRPGTWHWSVGQARLGIAAFDQYEHLANLQRLIDAQPELKAALGGDYLIIPDLIVSRTPLDDDELNRDEKLVNEKGTPATFSPLRKANAPANRRILHASISCKWTMRSDRAQNTRTEALNLIRNRKGTTPHIVVVTMEPLPSRLASIAMGTGDVNCTYHAALYELQQAAADSKYDDQAELLKDLIQGRRLRDISDLPLDLAI